MLKKEPSDYDKFSSEEAFARLGALDYSALTPEVLAGFINAMRDVDTALLGHYNRPLYSESVEGDPLNELAYIAMNVAKHAYHEIMSRAAKNKTILQSAGVLEAVCHFQAFQGAIDDTVMGPRLARIAQAVWQADKLLEHESCEERRLDLMIECARETGHSLDDLEKSTRGMKPSEVKAHLADLKRQSNG